MDQKVSLFAIPFAGGNSFSYSRMKGFCGELLDFKTIELPGRGTRNTEPLIVDIDYLVEDIFQEIKMRLDQPYILFGHSMGGLLAFLVTRKVLSEGYSPPLHLVVSARKAPSLRDPFSYGGWDDMRLMQLMIDNGGTSRELVENKEAMEFFLPVLRADLKILDSYIYQRGEPMQVPITAIIGDQDVISMAEARSWQSETSSELNIKVFPGGHFFVIDSASPVIDTITELACNNEYFQKKEENLR